MYGLVQFVLKATGREMVQTTNNVLYIDDVKRLYPSPEFSETAPRSFQCGLIFGVAVMTLMHSTGLSILQTTQFRKSVLHVKRSFIITVNMSELYDTCNNAKGKILQVKKTPKHIPTFDFW